MGKRATNALAMAKHMVREATELSLPIVALLLLRLSLLTSLVTEVKATLVLLSTHESECRAWCNGYY